MKVEIETPTVPNFIFINVGSQRTGHSVADFSVEELKEIGRKWTESLVANAANKRKLENGTKLK
jgi:hypothetical protein